jgi:hypothetical protein
MKNFGFGISDFEFRVTEQTAEIPETVLGQEIQNPKSQIRNSLTDWAGLDHNQLPLTVSLGIDLRNFVMTTELPAIVKPLY